MMMLLTFGFDVSKGYLDACFQDPAGHRLKRPSRRYDDTPAGHAALRKALTEVAAEFPAALFRLGLECSGGLERNWLACLMSWAQNSQHTVYHLNALAVKRFRERELHGSGTDARSAQAIASYLRSGLRQADRPYEPRDEGGLVRYRFTCNTQDRGIQVQNELHALLPAVHPGLVQYCRKGYPEWVLLLLALYPSAPALAHARPATVARVPYVTLERATGLVTAAKASVGALSDPATAATVKALAQEVLRLRAQVDALKEELGKEWASDPVVRRLETVAGIGRWTAVVLRLEVGDFTRFRSVAGLVAYAGLDPRYDQSGDGESRYRISKRGRSQIRAALFMSALSSLRWNPVIAAFYRRLVGRGVLPNVALTACMGKLLRLAYACVVTETDFDVQYEAKRVERRAAAETTPLPTEQPDLEVDTAPAAEATAAMSAPVTWREAKRRRAATRPQVGGTQQVRGPGTALPTDDTRPVQPPQC